jgi:hypothetical protein
VKGRKQQSINPQQCEEGEEEGTLRIGARGNNSISKKKSRILCAKFSVSDFWIRGFVRKFYHCTAALNSIKS